MLDTIGEGGFIVYVPEREFFQDPFDVGRHRGRDLADGALAAARLTGGHGQAGNSQETANEDQLHTERQAGLVDVAPSDLVSDLVRERLGLTGTHVGCDTSQCGACVVHIDGMSVKSCTALAVTLEGKSHHHRGTCHGQPLHPMQQAFTENHGLQCGFCTPGMIMSAVDFAERNPAPTPEGVRRWLEGNMCRCTGYQNIVASVMAGTAAMQTKRSMTMGNPTGIGVSLLRKEDKRFITGHGNYVADIKRPDMLMGAFLRSPHAHALIKSIDTEAALALPGVVAVLTGEDLKADGVGGLPCAWPVTGKDGTATKEPAHPALAQGKVRCVGDAVAFVIAETLEQARAAAEAVVVDYEVATRGGRRARCAQAGSSRRLRRHSRQRLLRLGPGRQARHRCRLQEGGARGQDQPGQQPPGRQSDGAACRDRRIRPRAGSVHAVDHQPVSAHREVADGQLRPEHSAAQIAGGIARRRRRLRRQAVPLCRRSGGHLVLERNWAGR